MIARPAPGIAVDTWLRALLAERPSPYLTSHRQRYTALLSLLDTLPLGEGIRVLEVGGGDGSVAVLLRDRYGWQITAVDCLDSAVELARGRGISAEPCDIDRQSLPFDAESFNLVLFDSVIEHLYRPSRAITEIKRVLMVGGHVLLGTPNATSVVLRLRMLAGESPFARFNRFNAIEDQAFMRECAVFYTPAEVAALMAPEIEMGAPTWTHLHAPHQEHRPGWRKFVTPLRIALCEALPPLSDFFYVVGRKRHIDPALARGGGSPY